MRRLRTLPLLGATLVLVSVGSVALAEGRESDSQLDYAAPAGCPDAESVASAIRARGPRVHAAHAGDAAPVVKVRVERDGSHYVGTLVVGGAGAEARRELRAPTCEAAVDALAIVAALAIEPGAGPASSPGSAGIPAPPPPPPPAPPSASPLPPAALQEPPTPYGVPPVAALAPREEPTAPSFHAQGRSRLRIGVGVAAEVLSLDAPGAVFAPVGRLDFSLDRPGIFAPSFRASFTRAEGGSIAVGADEATFTWVRGALEVCPLSFHLIGRLTASPCLGAGLGALGASTEGASHPTSPSRLWVDGTAAARLAWSILPSVSLQLDGGALVPFTRKNFVFEPGAVHAYAPPNAAATTSLGVTVFFL